MGQAVSSARDGGENGHPPLVGNGVDAAAGALIAGVEHTKQSGSSFALSFLLLSKERRRGMATLYGFCRAVDDCVDEAPDVTTGRAAIAFWQGELAAIEGGATPVSPLGRELMWAVSRFGLRIDRLRAIVEGCARDLDLAPFADQESLDDYCWHVASAVGLCCLPIFGAVATERGDEEAEAAARAAENYAEKLGLALQLTNILRDLRADAEIGRCYVPVADLEAHGVRREWLLGTATDEVYALDGPVHRLVGTLAARARSRFAEAHAVAPRRFHRELMPARVMGTVYRDLLRRVERRAGRLAEPLPRVPKSKRLWYLAKALCGSLLSFR